MWTKASLIVFLIKIKHIIMSSREGRNIDQPRLVFSRVLYFRSNFNLEMLQFSRTEENCSIRGKTHRVEPHLWKRRRSNHCTFSVPANLLGQVVQKPVNANPGLKANQNISFSCIKMLFTAYFLCRLR